MKKTQGEEREIMASAGKKNGSGKWLEGKFREVLK